jgi:hypothetical protein
MTAIERSRVRPRALRKINLTDEILRLRRNGLSYRAIASEVGRSKSQVQRLCDAAFAEVAEQSLATTAATLGEELYRVDGQIRAASAILESSSSTPTEKLRAVGEIRKCSEAKVRWLGADAPQRVLVGAVTREQLVDSELAGLSDEQLERELEALGWRRDPDAHARPSATGGTARGALSPAARKETPRSVLDRG